MKKILLLITFLSSFAFADTSAIEEILYSGDEAPVQMLLQTEKTHTEYETVYVPGTCYRTEYRQRCTTQRRVCRNYCNARGQCTTRCTGGGVQCRMVPVQIPYQCQRAVTRSYEVHDYYVDTNITFNFSHNDAQNISESFKVKVTGENYKLSVNGSKNYFIMQTKKREESHLRAGIKTNNITYDIELISADMVKDVLAGGMKNVSLRNGVFNFTLGQGFDLNHFNHRIRVYRYKLLGSDDLLLDTDLNSNDISFENSGTRSNISVDINTLGINVPSKVRIITDISFKLDESKLLNKDEIDYKTYSNWIFK